MQSPSSADYLKENLDDIAIPLSWSVTRPGRIEPMAGYYKSTYRRLLRVCLEKLIRFAMAWAFVFVVIFAGGRLFAAKIDASDHIAKIAPVDWYIIALLMTIVLYIGFYVFRYATDRIE